VSVEAATPDVFGRVVVLDQVKGVLVALVNPVTAEQVGVELFQEKLGELVVVGIFIIQRVAFIDIGQDALFLH